MATRPELHRAVQGTKNTATNYNDNFDAMMDFIDDSIDEAKSYVDDFMPSVTGKAGKFLTNDGTDTSWAVAVPVGTVFYYGFTSAPTGWLICDGSAVSRTTYADLYSAIGTIFGTGDGETTFNLPNLINKFPQGNTTVGTVKAAGLPNIVGSVQHVTSRTAINNIVASGCFTSTKTGEAGYDGGSHKISDNNIELKASRNSSIYGASSTVQPPALTLLPIIKY